MSQIIKCLNLKMIHFDLGDKENREVKWLASVTAST